MITWIITTTKGKNTGCQVQIDVWLLLSIYKNTDSLLNCCSFEYIIQLSIEKEI